MTKNTQALFALSDDEAKHIQDILEEAYRPLVGPEEDADPDDPETDMESGTAWVDVTFRFMDGRRVIMIESSDGYRSGPIW